MKKKLFVICALLLALLLTGCGENEELSIDGVWQMDVSVIGEGVDENTTGYVEYEFFGGYGRRTDCVNGEIRSAEGFTYTLNEDAVVLSFEDGTEQEYTWAVSGKNLVLADLSAETQLESVKRNSVAYLPDGYIAPLELTIGVNVGDRLLSHTETAQLLQLLRSAKAEKQTEEPYSGMVLKSFYAIGNDAFELELIDGVLYCGNKETAYKLSNSDEIECFLAELIASQKTAENMVVVEGVWRSETANEYIYSDYEFFDGRGRYIGYGASGIYSVMDFSYTIEGDTLSWCMDSTWKKKDFTISYDGEILRMDAADVSLELVPVERKSVPYLPDGFIEPVQVTRTEDGKAVQLKELENGQLLELLRSNEVSGRQTVTLPIKVQYSIGNEGFQIKWGQGLLYLVEEEQATVYTLSKAAEIQRFIEELTWEEAPKAVEKIEPANVVDVRKTEKTVKELSLSADKCAEICKLLNQGQATAMGEEELSREAYFYSITVENYEGYERVVFLSDNGRVYMNGQRYELTTANELLGKLTLWADEMRIVQYGNDITEWNAACGESQEVDLVGTPDAADVVWSSSNDAVCAVAGKNNSAEITAVGLGEAVITVQWQGRSDSIAVTVKEAVDYTSKISDEDLRAAEQLAREDYEAWREEDWCLSMKVLEAVVNEEESQRMRKNYEGCRDGWNREYMTEDFVAVKVTYECELDHNKIWYDDGKITRHTYLTRADAESPWEIWDYGYA